MNLPVPPTDPGLLAGDTAAVGIAAATWMAMLPNIAAVLSVLWLVMRVGDQIYTWYKQYTAVPPPPVPPVLPQNLPQNMPNLYGVSPNWYENKEKKE